MKPTEKMYNAGLAYLNNKGIAWYVNELFMAMEAARENTLVISDMLYCDTCRTHTKHDLRDVGDLIDADICCTICCSITTTQLDKGGE